MVATANKLQVVTGNSMASKQATIKGSNPLVVAIVLFLHNKLALTAIKHQLMVKHNSNLILPIRNKVVMVKEDNNLVIVKEQDSKEVVMGKLSNLVLGNNRQVVMGKRQERLITKVLVVMAKVNKVVTIKPVAILKDRIKVVVMVRIRVHLGATTRASRLLLAADIPSKNKVVVMEEIKAIVEVIHNQGLDTIKDRVDKTSMVRLVV